MVQGFCQNQNKVSVPAHNLANPYDMLSIFALYSKNLQATLLESRDFSQLFVADASSNKKNPKVLFLVGKIAHALEGQLNNFFCNYVI